MIEEKNVGVKKERKTISADQIVIFSWSIQTNMPWYFEGRVLLSYMYFLKNYLVYQNILKLNIIKMWNVERNVAKTFEKKNPSYLENIPDAF